MTTEHSYEALLFEYGHDPQNNLKATVKILNDPLPDHVLLGQELFQALYQTGIPWASLTKLGEEGDPLDPEPISPDEIANHPDDWRVSFSTVGLEAQYKVLGIQTFEPYAVQLQLESWTTV